MCNDIRRSLEGYNCTCQECKKRVINFIEKYEEISTPIMYKDYIGFLEYPTISNSFFDSNKYNYIKYKNIEVQCRYKEYEIKEIIDFIINEYESIENKLIKNILDPQKEEDLKNYRHWKNLKY